MMFVECGLRAYTAASLGRTMERDSAAGQGVACFAGGGVTTLDGPAPTYGKPGFENPRFVVRGKGV